jgi:hypothetical protein
MGLDTSAVVATILAVVVVVPMVVPACCWLSLPIVCCPCLSFVVPACRSLSLPIICCPCPSFVIPALCLSSLHFVCYPSVVPTCRRAVIQYSSTHAPPHEQWLTKLEVGACCCHLRVLWFHQPPCEKGPAAVVASLSQV